MPFGVSGIPSPYTTLTSTKTDIYGVFAETLSVNRHPLFMRLDQARLNAPEFRTTTRGYVPRSTLMNDSSGIDNAVTTMVVADASIFQPEGDVIEIENEQMLVTAVNYGTNTLTITRAYGGTSAASHADALAVYRISNTRRGNEVDVDPVSASPTILTQYGQTIQIPYAIGGVQEAYTNLALPPGVTSALGLERAQAMMKFGDDLETALLYGRGVALGSTTARPQMIGLRSLLTTNNTAGPQSAASYKPSDLARDLTQKCLEGGGAPDVILAASNFQVGLQTWGVPLTRLPAGATQFGVSIDIWSAPFMNDMTWIYHPLLRAGTIIALTSREVNLMVTRQVFDKPRGSRGDAYEGDIIGTYSLRVDNEAHHAYVSGVTGFAAQ